MAVASWAGYPASYTPARNRPIAVVVIHYTAGSEGPLSAEAGAAYDKTRTDGTSTHVFADSNSVIREVPDNDIAHAALWHANMIGLHLEICGTVQTRAQWLDDTSRATLRMAARQTAEWCRTYEIPVRRLSVEQTRAAYYAAPGNRPKGVVGHVDVTQAFPEDGGTHTDPGPEFPWDVFLAMVRQELGEDDDMAPMILLQEKGIALLYIHPVLGVPVWANAVSGAAVSAWKEAGVPMAKVDSINDHGRNAHEVADELIAALQAGTPPVSGQVPESPSQRYVLNGTVEPAQ